MMFEEISTYNNYYHFRHCLEQVQPEINQQLHKKYQLSENEIKFIESMIKPMTE